MKAFIKVFLQRIRLKNPREVKMILIAIICSLLFTVFFQLYLGQMTQSLRNENKNASL